MGTYPLSTILMLIGTTAAHVIGAFLLPQSKGFTVLLPSLAVAASFLTGVVLLSRLIYSGVNLSVVIPLVSAAVPLFSILFGVVVYGDTASLAKIILLIAACFGVFVASYL